MCFCLPTCTSFHPPFTLSPASLFTPAALVIGQQTLINHPLLWASVSPLPAEGLGAHEGEGGPQLLFSWAPFRVALYLLVGPSAPLLLAFPGT